MNSIVLRSPALLCRHMLAITLFTTLLAGCQDGWQRRVDETPEPQPKCRYPSALWSPRHGNKGTATKPKVKTSKRSTVVKTPAPTAAKPAPTQSPKVSSATAPTPPAVATPAAPRRAETPPPVVRKAPPQPAPPAPATPKKALKKDMPGACVDINTATAQELTRLPGVGPRRASLIVAARERRPFKKKKHLQRVSGIAHRTYQKLAPHVCDF